MYTKQLEEGTQRDICIHIAALFTVDKSLNQPKGSVTDDLKA